MIRFLIVINVFIVILSCASSRSRKQEEQARDRIPANSPFAKINVGMTQRQVYELIGKPKSTIRYRTGKSFFPFYAFFGSDGYRSRDYYEGAGQITFTGGCIFTGVPGKIYRIIYDPAEDGYVDAPKEEGPQKAPSRSSFSRIRKGMDEMQVRELIGMPDDRKMYMTGKMFIPFYFGNDHHRVEYFYKGEGRIIFASSFAGSDQRVYRIIYDPTEDGYNN